MKTLARMRRVSAEEIRWRTQARARIWRDRARATVKPRRWDRRALRRALVPGVLHPLQDAIRHGDWLSAHRTLAHQLRDRPVRFALDPAAMRAMRRAILARWPDAAGDARARADRLVAGRHDLLGYRDLVFTGDGDTIDWHLDPVHGRRAPRRFWADVPYLSPACGDHKIIWEVNRHQHWLAFGRALWLTGDPRYRHAILDQLAGWLAANPPLTGINWASMLELGFRSISWVWALHVLLGDAPAADDDTPWLVDLLIGLDRQLAHVEQNLSYYFSPNTHLTGEALALYVAGRALPELAASTRWAETGRRVLLAEIARQILPDGGHAERSTHYHRYTLDFYVLALIVADRTGDTEAGGRFRDAVARLAAFMREIADDGGHIPLIGDDDGGMLWPFLGPGHADVRPSLAAAAAVLNEPALAPWPVPEDVYWIAWPEARRLDGMTPGLAATAQRDARATAFPDTGYVAMRDGTGGHAVFDAGAHGYLNGGHAHADALALTLVIGGRRWLVDPGTATYVMDPQLRDRLRLSTSHNTVTIDGHSFAVPAGPFHWASTAHASIETCRTNPRFGWAEGAHASYPGVRHRRSVLASSIGWCVVDQVAGTGSHRADLLWHFDPAWSVQNDDATRLRARHADGSVGWLLCDAGDIHLTRGGDGDGEAGGWCSRSYGALEPTWTARVTRQGDLPLVFVTWMLQGTRDGTPHLHRLPIADGGEPPLVAAHLRDGATESFLLMRTQDAPGAVQAGPYRTDGRLLHVCRRDGRCMFLELIDATAAMADGDEWISVSAGGERMADLHVALSHGRIDVWTSGRVACLEVRGSYVSDLRGARMNGREVPFQLSPGTVRLGATSGLAIARGSAPV